MYLDKKVIIIIVAAGKGTRMKINEPKQFLYIKGKSILYRTIEKFEVNEYVDDIVLVINQNDIKNFKNKINNKYTKIKTIVEGGKSRMKSVYNGLCSIYDDNSIILIHDGVRPFVSQKIINKCTEKCYEYDACIPATEIIDTIKIKKDGFVKTTVDRSTLISVQTPQAFKYKIIKKCYEKAMNDNLIVTDDASIVENYNYKVKIVEGDRENIKITTPLDLIMANIILDEDKKRILYD